MKIEYQPSTLMEEMSAISFDTNRSLLLMLMRKRSHLFFTELQLWCSRLEFPRFDGDDPTRWIYKAKQYFDGDYGALDWNFLALMVMTLLDGFTG